VSALDPTAGPALTPTQVRTPRFARLSDNTRVQITLPKNGHHLLRDVDLPPEQATVALHATVDPPVAQIVWYVDGAPIAVADYPYSARWPLKPGEHRIEARVPYTDARSASVGVTVQ
jgi:penicillin-binding protein 1C